MTGSVVFDPLLPWAAVYALAALGGLAAAVALWRGLPGWWLRLLASASLVAAVANPAFQQEERAPLSDIVLLVADESASQGISDRAGQTREAVTGLSAALAALPDTEVRTVTVPDGTGDEGTLLATALAEALAEEPPGRVAGAILVTDGQLHDVERLPALPAPLHVLLTGRDGDWDRRLVVRNAPAFAILGEEVQLTLLVEDQGAVPEGAAGPVELSIAVDGGEPMRFSVPVGEDITLPVTLPHGGMNVLQFEVPEAEGELTARNNAAVVQINGVRDRLRVLLVSGEPHAGERTWRNLLKADSAVDLVHFTILRPPEKQDGVPVSELSLIAFPTRELFVEKIEEFDLIIFDRYQRRGILPNAYIENIRTFIEGGGAVLVSAGPDYASADSLYRSPLAGVLPAAPSGRVIEAPYRPVVSELGARHPVTSGLEGAADGADGAPTWGRWFRAIDVEPGPEADVLMEGPDGRPLLILDRVGEGRVALLASDHAWLWSRGYEGGGPQLELLRRLAHWMMKEPELEEEALTASAAGQTVTVVRRTLEEGDREVTVTAPDGSETVLPLTEVEPGRHSATFTGLEMGLYRLADGEMSAVVALGPAAPREFEETIATGERLLPAVEATRGGILRLEDGVPDIRRVGEGRNAAGRGWIGITPREAYLTADVRIDPLLPAWLFLLIAATLTVGAWLREGRR
ncbi:MAG: hypothetical protein MUE98_06925 [Rhodobacteraceae bacterium]|nr:hypothetical protein [Paracoccaceae bacterium]